jgi:hypothetical protein
MPQRIIRNILTLFTIAFASATIALAQFATSTEVQPLTTSDTHDITLNSGKTWQGAQVVGSSMGKLLVVTIDQPDRRQTCRVHSFTLDKLVCSHAIGGPRTYLPQQVAALFIPGDGHLKLRLVLGLNGGMGAAIWGTVVLAATCPACAVGTGIAALLLFLAAGAILIGDDQPDRLLYIAPGLPLSGKLGYVQR